MLSAISSVRPTISFRATDQEQAAQNIISREGAHTRPADAVAPASQAPAKKSNSGLKALLTAVIIAAAGYLGLGLMARHGGLKVNNEAKGLGKVKNFFASIGEHCNKKLYTKKIKPADGEAPKGDAPKNEAPKGDAPKGNAPKNEAPKGEAPTGKTSKKASKKNKGA